MQDCKTVWTPEDRLMQRPLYPLKGMLTFTFIVANLSFWIGPVFMLALLKLALPLQGIRLWLYGLMAGIYRWAVWTDDVILRRLMGIRMEVRGLEELQQDKFYLVLSNHRSWADIFVLQSLLNFKAPIPKFIVKRQLVYMPLVGLICWAYDFPFVRRYTREARQDRPERQGEDRKTIQTFLSRFDETPGSIVNFAEGTRYTLAKAERGSSAYRFLLSPKAGGLNVILQSMGDRLHQILDLTLCYDRADFNFWDFLCGKCRRVIVRVRHIAPETAWEKARNGAATILSAEAAEWIGRLWKEKDEAIGKMIAEIQPAKSH